MSQFKLSSTLAITVKEAEELIENYFKAFPRIKRCLDGLGEFGVRNGYIMTLSPFYRKRWFPEWENLRTEIEYHVQGIEHNKLLGGIERQSKNTPIQGASADMMKLALIKCRRYINDNNLRGKVKLVMQVHDQLTTMVKADYAEEWAPTLTALMEEAAKVIIPTGLLKADTQITNFWQK